MSKSLTALLLLAAPGLAGCAGSLLTADGERLRLRSEAFAEYAEGVFRLQNEVLDALAFALDERPEDSALVAAEDHVLEACAALNGAALRRQRGDGTRPLRDLGAARSVPECEAAAAMAAEQLRARGR